MDPNTQVEKTNDQATNVMEQFKPGGRQHGELLKVFPNFLSGLSEVRTHVPPFQQSITRALDKLPMPDVMVTVGEALKLQESLVMFALINQAANTPNLFWMRPVMAIAHSSGFNYRSRSGFIFGWRRERVKDTTQYKFFVRIGPASRYTWVPAVMEKLIELGWEDLAARKSRNKVRRQLQMHPGSLTKIDPNIE